MIELHCVYECWMRDVPLYVGVTSNLSRRLREHRRRQAWYKVADRFVVTIYPTRREAERAEVHRIQELRPANNRAHIRRAAA